LHAKLYVADAGWHARVWTGSANATNAAFERNVEFLVELQGKKSRCGIDSLLGNAEEDVTGLASLLQEYVPGTEQKVDPEKTRLESLAEGARRALAAAEWSAKVTALSGEAERFEVRLLLEEECAPEIAPEVHVRCWPITLTDMAVDISSERGEVSVFSPLSFEALTTFFAFEVTASSEMTSVRQQFTLNVPLSGAPTNRQERILRSLLDSREKVLRLILLLLSEEGQDKHEALIAAQGMLGGGAGNGSGPVPFPLFEALVRALERDPSRLDQIAKLLDDLRKTPEGRHLIPEGLNDVWQPILEARRRLKA
jgi:hypothetical protein